MRYTLPLSTESAPLKIHLANLRQDRTSTVIFILCYSMTYMPSLKKHSRIMKTRLFIITMSFLTGQVLGQEVVPFEYLYPVFEDSLKDQTIFYTADQKEYVFKVDQGKKSSRLALQADSIPKYTHLDSVYVVTTLSETENQIQLSLPPLNGIDVLPFMPAIMSYEIILGKEMQKMKPTLELNIQEKSCTGLIHPNKSEGNEVDSAHVCFYFPYVEERLRLFDRKERLCYKNHSEWTDSSGKYNLVYWFEPEEFGFVKFILDSPAGDQLIIELVEVN